MSHFTTVRTILVATDCLLKALADLGYKTVEVHEEPQRLYGYRGDLRKQKAEVIIRRKQVGRSSNDLGFLRNHQGHYDAIISAFDRNKHNKTWMEKLTQRYAYHVAREKLAEQGFDVVEEKKESDGKIRLVLRRTA